tara:strand:+ start:11858 stop:11989 length:132 start_codon:yes stop_codon:yes gene_type:complete
LDSAELGVLFDSGNFENAKEIHVFEVMPIEMRGKRSLFYFDLQ